MKYQNWLITIISIFITVFAMIPCAGAITAQGKTYYVSPNGSDGNTGTSTTEAWQSIDKVNAQDFQPGDRVAFAGGKIFAGTIVLDADDSGIDGAPVTITSYDCMRKPHAESTAYNLV